MSGHGAIVGERCFRNDAEKQNEGWNYDVHLGYIVFPHL